MKNEKIKLFLVDDDAVFLKSLEIEFLEHADFVIETYPTGELCMEHLSHSPDVIILDYMLNGIVKTAMNGMDTLDKIEVAINCMHHRAFDYVVKSETAFVRLQKIISTIFRYKKMEKELKWYMERV